MSESFFATPSPLWRALNWMRDMEIAGQRRRIVTILNECQPLDFDDLATLEERGWVQYWLPTEAGDMPFLWSELVDRAPIRITQFGVMYLTPGGMAKVAQPWNKVLRLLREHRRSSPLAQVRQVKQLADVDDKALIEMAEVDLITAGAEGVPLAAFRKLPPKLPLRLTPKAGRYLREGVIEVRRNGLFSHHIL
ncbi:MULTISPECIES: hypothetical protein [Catenuloplanes]|uniref:Uncharacterized protein n=1 Tax=Catenuloplanes niger TaxID=587534 RepID=A0AAE4CRI7_9ACTN|nr:hypothetical protein [Catenuloplanes niger]MDR7322946.1 hypothetical protein [Catenuloplanes niger]